MDTMISFCIPRDQKVCDGFAECWEWINRFPAILSPHSSLSPLFNSLHFLSHSPSVILRRHFGLHSVWKSISPIPSPTETRQQFTARQMAIKLAVSLTQSSPAALNNLCLAAPSKTIESATQLCLARELI